MLAPKRGVICLLASAILVALLSSTSFAQILGTIDFPTAVEGKAQEHFVEGVLYLHSFEFEDAREEFQKAQSVSPGFVMAIWGESLTHNHPLWRAVDVDSGRAVLEKLGKTPEERYSKASDQKTRDFLRSLDALYGPGDKAARDLAYSHTLEEMYERYPGDHEVASFYALSILAVTNGVRDFRNYMRAASIAEEVFRDNPRHPGAAHYLIHSYDDPIHAPLGLRAARVYASIAPAASHAQHMISHIYVALGQWDQAVEANENAWRVSQERIKRKHLGVGQGDFHSFFWLHYSYLQQGRYEKAQEMLDVVQKASESGDTDRLGGYYSRMREIQVLETRDWSTRLPPSKGAFADHFADALVAISTGQIARGMGIMEQMQPERPPHKIQKLELEALFEFQLSENDKAIELLKKACAMEDEIPLSYGPPLPSKPSHELMGEILLKLGRHEDAREHFEKALLRAPRRALSLLGLARAAERSGDRKTATETYATLADVWKHADEGIVGLREVRRAGVTDGR